MTYWIFAIGFALVPLVFAGGVAMAWTWIGEAAGCPDKDRASKLAFMALLTLIACVGLLFVLMSILMDLL